MNPTKVLDRLKALVPWPSQPRFSLKRRQVLLTGLAAFAGGVLGVAGLPAQRRSSCEVLRPPGAVDEERFLKECLRCGFCTWNCPTGVIQPAGLEAGPEGIFTPVMKMEIGYCTFCASCSACPKDLLRRYHRRDRSKFPKIGLAVVDRTSCRTNLAGQACTTCYEGCAESQKAISLGPFSQPDGRTVLEPVVDSERCVGCGRCEHRCPATPARGIRVLKLTPSGRT